MSTQFLCNVEMMQPEQQKILVERMPVYEGEKLSADKNPLESIRNNPWEDLLGLSLGFEEDGF